jgi:hypothetical protein
VANGNFRPLAWRRNSYSPSFLSCKDGERPEPDETIVFVQRCSVTERERIQALEAKLKQLKTLQTRREARARTTAAKKSRGEELRRKILAGAVLLSKVEAGEFGETVLREWMEKALTRPEDRALFGLEAQ